MQKITILIAILASIGAFTVIVTRECQFKKSGLATTTDNSMTRERSTSTAGSHSEVRRESFQALFDAYQHPIALYGRVVDQFGQSVSGATVEIFVHSEHFGEKSGADTVLTTDEEGAFSITGLKGSSIGASAMKEGYLRIPALNSISSSASLGYTGGDGSGDRYSIPSSPIVLELLKVGPVEPMIHVGKQRWKLPLDATPKMIALDSEKGEGRHQVEFRFSSDTHIRQLPGNNAYTSFDWSFEIRVPGGGVAWDESDLKFEAPESGYKEMVRYQYLASMPGGEWRRVQDGRYFVKFADNTYGRIQFNMDGGSDRRPLYMESWLNLKPNSRNLATEKMIINVVESEEP